ncbi:sodium:proton antiporter [Marinilactibacillus sp. Marseille-P9653]|uniref:cation:proton antiporter n=1 Tax=Marinilactibacillus sp. Marseille-P9653 TaxID=2866583 RepID=UPI001CE3EC91|nr:cation:proton antiporter [Marinilactibacillus sp. Marseille-P9653]
MLTSFALIFIFGLLLGGVAKKLALPGLIGMIFAGVLIGPHALDLLDDSLLSISSDLRSIALVIILTRAGLSLNVTELKKIGLPALLMSFVPAILEITAITLLAPLFFDLTYIESALMGSVVAAVSPAVIVPLMLKIKESGYGQKRGIPQLVLASASLDDIFVIVLFSSFLSVATGGAVTARHFLTIPVSIVLGSLLGVATGLFLGQLFKRIQLNPLIKVLITLSVSFLLLALEGILESKVALSGLLAIMSMGIVLNQLYPNVSAQLSKTYSGLWVGAEILLFVLVGTTVDLRYALTAGLAAIVMVLAALVFRMLGVWISLTPSQLTKKETLFTMIAYTPKATVQAAIGGVPLAMELASGELIATVAVLSILITAPIGAFAIEQTYKTLLDER